LSDQHNACQQSAEHGSCAYMLEPSAYNYLWQKKAMIIVSKKTKKFPFEFKFGTFSARQLEKNYFGYQFHI
jgi:hypothetical protein